MDSYWQLGDELRGQTRASEDQKWLMAVSKMAEQTRSKGERMINLDLSNLPAEVRPSEKFGFREASLNFNMLNLDADSGESMGKSSMQSGILHKMNTGFPKTNIKNMGNLNISKYIGNAVAHKEPSNKNSNDNANVNSAVDKRFKTLPASEILPRNEVLGGYIFVCNNDTMQEDLKRQLFGLPPRYRDSVRAITPGLPLFLYNYTTHQLHGIFEATSFGGTNIDPTAWEDKKCKGESRFPAQVRIRVRKVCNALEEDAFRPVLHHYDGPKFRLELSVPETLDLLDLCEQAGSQ
ncbi:PREDICTED: B2 protein-like [Tarenaya hassleriana]|uniref:B2 protein-like n=1 Tax=Tarenaya hassleriana TaxID=28532 RepID=UPI00053C6CE5|nr:PREDICTED: B2 protein-like [Tarenaya hassleriana]